LHILEYDFRIVPYTKKLDNKLNVAVLLQNKNNNCYSVFPFMRDNVVNFKTSRKLI